MCKIGIQLYSVHKEIAQRGFDEMLCVVKEAGFNCVEFAGFYGHTPEEVVALCKKHDLAPVSAHIGVKEMEESLPYIDALGIKKVYIPWVAYEDLADNFDELVKEIKRVKVWLDERGVELGYHNHAQEYRDGGDKFYDLLCAIDGFTAEPDIFWVKAGGHEPLEILEKYGDKVTAVHVKELDKRWKEGENPRDYPCAIVGEGQSDSRNAMAYAKSKGIDLFVLEVEGFPCAVEECLKKSCDNMKQFLK